MLGLDSFKYSLLSPCHTGKLACKTRSKLLLKQTIPEARLMLACVLGQLCTNKARLFTEGLKLTPFANIFIGRSLDTKIKNIYRYKEVDVAIEQSTRRQDFSFHLKKICSRWGLRPTVRMRGYFGGLFVNVMNHLGCQNPAFVMIRPAVTEVSW